MHTYIYTYVYIHIYGRKVLLCQRRNECKFQTYYHGHATPKALFSLFKTALAIKVKIIQVSLATVICNSSMSAIVVKPLVYKITYYYDS